MFRRTETIDFKRFIRNEYRNTDVLKVVPFTGGFAVFTPGITYAAENKDEAFSKFLDAGFGIVDWICVGVFVFAGLSWMFGNRTKSIEYLIGGSVGYAIARNAINIKDWLHSIVVVGG